MRLRDYQTRLLSDIYLALSRVNRVCAQLSTGGGKSLLFKAVAENNFSRHKRTIIIAHREELIRQGVRHIERAGIPSNEIGVVKAGYPFEPDKPVQVASIQTLVNRELPPVDFVIIDEFHHGVADSYQKVLEGYAGLPLVGFTATPCRLDNRGLAEVSDELVCGPPMKELIKAGWLSPYDLYSAPPLDLSGVRKVAGDYSRKSLRELVNKQGIAGNPVQDWKAYADGLRTFVFAIDVEHSQQVVEQYRAAGIAADHVDANCSPQERRERITRFIKGETLVLSNVGIFTEGFDLASIAELEGLDECSVDCVQILRPSQSLAFYLQCVGRALRPFPGKQKAIILDNANCRAIHGLPDDEFHWSLEGVKNETRLKEEAEKRRAIEQENRDRERVVYIGGRLVKVERGSVVEHLMVAIRKIRSPYQKRSEFSRWAARYQPTLEDMVFAATQVMNYKKAAGYYLWLEMGNRPRDVSELKDIARLLGNHWKWAEHEWKRLKTNRLVH
jgi:superfamily II DNA or RNA helicase